MFICILVGVVFNLLNRIYAVLKQSEERFCARVRYTKSLTATSYIQCKQSIKTVVLKVKLTNIERPNHVARDEETGGIQLICMASRTDTLFSFYHFVPIISTFYNNQACHNDL